MYYLLVQILMPLTLCSLLTWIALCYLFRKPTSRLRRLAVVVPLAGLTVATLPVTAYLSIGSLEWGYPPQGRPHDCQAIVILGGHVRRPDEIRKNDELAEDTVARCLHAVDLYKQGKACRVFVCGGNVDHVNPGRKLAEVMRDFLLRYGVSAKDVVVEGKSLNTYSNVVEVCKLLRQNNLERVVVVTDATHLRRTKLCFDAQGFPVQLSGCRYRATRFQWSPLAFLPKPYAAADVEDAAHEWIGILWYSLRGWI